MLDYWIYLNVITTFSIKTQFVLMTSLHGLLRAMSNFKDLILQTEIQQLHCPLFIANFEDALSF